MSGNNVSRFLPGIMLERQKDIFDSIFCIIHVFHFFIQFFVLRQGKKEIPQIEKLQNKFLNTSGENFLIHKRKKSNIKNVYFVNHFGPFLLGSG